MPKIVEIIGPSGSGKSSVYNTLKQRWEYGDDWVTYDQVNYSPEARFTRIIQKGKRVLKDLIPRKKPDVPKTVVNSKWKFVESNNNYFLGEDHSEFKSIVMDLIGKHCKKGFTGADKRFITAYMIMWSMGRIEKVKSIKQDQRFCILDQGEGLISRIMHLTTPSFDEEALNVYLKHVPKPDVLFYLKTDLETITERINTRDRSSSLHEGMSESEIYQYTKKTNDFLRKAAEILESDGVEVHTVDSSEAIDQMVTKIIHLLSQKK